MIKTLIYLASLACIVVGVMWFVNSDYINAISVETTSAAKTVKEVVTGPEEKNEDTAWRFGFISDIEGEVTVGKQIVEDARTRDLDFMVYGGDLVQRANVEGASTVMDLLESTDLPVHYVIGNNDLIYDETIERKTRDFFTTHVDERLYYRFEHNGSDIYILDNSYLRDGFQQEELDWLEQELKQHAEDGPNFLFYHRPIKLPGESFFGDDETPDSRVQNDKFRAIISHHEIDRIFNGHLHLYLGYTLDETPVTVAGGGGAEPQSLLGGSSSAFYHYLVVSVYEDGTHDVEVVEL